MIAHAAFRSLRLEGVGRSFGAVKALDNLTLEVKRGEFVALLGPSGCGKSTALNCIAGLLTITGGSIWLDDARIDTLPVEERGFGMVFQNYALFPHMNVRANVGFGLRMRRVAKAEIARRVDEAIRTVRLETQAEKLPGQLSGGQQQRVAIARAIAIDPPLVLMDEPLSNLDAKLRLEMRQEIRRIHQGLGCVTIYVTHDQDEALSLADRIVVLRDGEVRQIGAPHELYARPARLDVAEFMGFRNRLSGRPAGAAGPGARKFAFGETMLEGVDMGLSRARMGVAAIRPEDLTPAPEGGPGIPARVEAIEYRGRDFFGAARTKGGVELFFRSALALQPGAQVTLAAEPSKVLIYPGEAP